MTGADRRQEIIRTLEKAVKPIPARDLAKFHNVSRQVIVQDVALIRAAGYDILSTNRGYILTKPGKVTRVFKVSHTDEQMEEELCAIVDLGAEVLNVMVHHKIYGTMEAPLNITSRKKVKQFMDDINSGKSSPLKNITGNYHYHTVSADNEKTLDEVQEVLQQKGFLVQQDA
jgi:hypothetical protein